MDQTEENKGSIPIERSLVVYVPQEQVTAPDTVNPLEPREVAYTVKDPYFGRFDVYKSANAWWMNRSKVENLILAFKNGHIVKAARYYAGITEGEYKYFCKIHPEFSTIKADLGEVQMFKAMSTINDSLNDPKTARWFLDRRHPKFASKVRVESEQPLQPTVQNNVAIGSININSREISDALKQIAREVFGASEDDSRAISDQAMEDMDSNEHGEVHGGDTGV